MKSYICTTHPIELLEEKREELSTAYRKIYGSKKKTDQSNLYWLPIWISEYDNAISRLTGLEAKNESECDCIICKHSKLKKCDRCGKPFPDDSDLPAWVRELLKEVTTCTTCLTKSLSALITPNK